MIIEIAFRVEDDSSPWLERFSDEEWDLTYRAGGLLLRNRSTNAPVQSEFIPYHNIVGVRRLLKEEA